MMMEHSCVAPLLTICNKCGNWLIAPEWSYEFPEEGSVINLWSCVDCGNQFETVGTAVGARSKVDNEPFEKSPPSLLAA
jgi:hypothetical protein